MKLNTLSLLIILSVLGLFGTLSCQTQKEEFKATFESLEKVNPVPEWFKDAKFGIYFHWGVYSTPAFANEWYPRNMNIRGSRENNHHVENYGSSIEWPYHYFISGAKDKKGNFIQFAPKLKSEGGNFDPEEWAQLFADAGAKFAGPVAEHHDGFSMWASKINPWNAKDMGPKLDLVGLLTDAIRKRDMKVILSMHHAYNITGFYDSVPKTNDPVLKKLYGQQSKEENEALWLNKHKEIIDNYKPDIIWQDFNLPKITDTVLLGFLSYYYNKANELNKEVVATYKDGLNTKCGVLDYERGGPPEITENYWLTDDAISSSSWCYTEGLRYYSTRQIFHGFIDRISKNGNLLLNISPMADGTIPQEQKDILLGFGSWLKKYGEAVYSTRAWEKFGEGPMRMGAAQGVFGAPVQGSSKDIRFTRSKDNKILYAILLGWEEGQKETTITSLTTDRIDCENLKSVELLTGEAGKYLPLSYKQTAKGLIAELPERPAEEMAYVLKLTFDGQIPELNRYVDLNSTPGYYIVPGVNNGTLVVGSDLTLTGRKKETVNQWKIETVGKGLYKILNRDNNNKALTCRSSGTSAYSPALTDLTGKDDQVWKIESSFNGYYKISNKQFPDIVLSVDSNVSEGSKVVLNNSKTDQYFGWKLLEVCDLKLEAFKPGYIPGIIEAENFNKGCPEEAYLDRDPANVGGEYRPDEAVDIEKCSAGGYNVYRISPGEWMTYTVTVNKTAAYEASFYLASTSDNAQLRLESDGTDITGAVIIPDTKGGQNWQVVKKTIKLNAGQTLLKLIFEGRNVAIDKIIFKELK